MPVWDTTLPLGLYYGADLENKIEKAFITHLI